MLKEVLGEILTFLHIPALGSLYPQLNQFRAIWVLELFVVFFFLPGIRIPWGCPGEVEESPCLEVTLGALITLEVFPSLLQWILGFFECCHCLRIFPESTKE